MKSRPHTGQWMRSPESAAAADGGGAVTQGSSHERRGAATAAAPVGTRHRQTDRQIPVRDTVPPPQTRVTNRQTDPGQRPTDRPTWSAATAPRRHRRRPAQYGRDKTGAPRTDRGTGQGGHRQAEDCAFFKESWTVRDSHAPINLGNILLELGAHVCEL